MRLSRHSRKSGNPTPRKRQYYAKLPLAVSVPINVMIYAKIHNPIWRKSNAEKSKTRLAIIGGG
ncbi:MAG: hypothetical protein ACR2P4_01235 [Gammaproteobacteria bacterium]